MISKVGEIRKEKQMTQDYLAQISGISRKYLSMIETNRAVPSVDIASRISENLAVNIDKLFINPEFVKDYRCPKSIRFIDLFCGIGGFDMHPIKHLRIWM